METHDHDPTTGHDGEADPWDAVAGELGDLKERLADTYRKVSNGDGPTEDEIRQAFATLAGAWDQVAESVTTALKDPEVRLKLKTAAATFASALGTTVTELGAELRDRPSSGSSEEQ